MTFQKTDVDNDHKISRAEFIQHMKLTKCIKQCQWDALFDELDADNSGALSHQEFWAKMAIKNSPGLMDALDQFDVSMANAQSRLVCHSNVHKVESCDSNVCKIENCVKLLIVMGTC